MSAFEYSGDEPTMFDLKAELTLDGRFRLVRRLGRGGMGDVWLAKDERLDGRKVALKVLRPEVAHDTGGVADLKRELILTRQLRHPGIVAVYDLHDPSGTVFISMEWVDGLSFAEGLAARGRKPLPLSRVLPWARQVALALDHAHGQGVLHRDVKPGNMLLARNGTVKLADFGIARVVKDTVSRQTGQAVSGTLVYMSPQQLMNEKGHRDDRRNDVYSFAATLYELLAGEPPFSGGDISMQIMMKAPDPIEGVPSAVNDALRAGLAKEIDTRPVTCDALVRRIASAGSATRVSVVAPPPRPQGKAAVSPSPQARGQVSVSPPPRPQGKAVVAPPPDQAGAPLRLDVGNGVTLEMVWIPPGAFLMGSPEDEEARVNNEGPLHRVEITQGFWLGKYPVTQAQWEAVMGSNPSYFQKKERSGWFSRRKVTRPDHPIDQVTWNDCQTFITRLNDRVSGDGWRVPNVGGWTRLCWFLRLPTEAEWEYACRAGTTTPFHFGNTISTDQANYNGNYTYGNGREGVYRRTTTPVGSFAANAWGLHDMHGNVWEWCNDWYASDHYGRGENRDPQGPSSGSFRVLRGGSWFSYPRGCRSASRNYLTPGYGSSYLGFRLALPPVR